MVAESVRLHVHQVVPARRMFPEVKVDYLVNQGVVMETYQSIV